MSPVSRRDQLREESGSYTPRLVACFYSIFDPIVGPRVLHQIPEGSVATALSTFPSRPEGQTDAAASTLSPPPSAGLREGAESGEPIVRSNPVLFEFASIIDFVIPKPELCGHLITKATRTSKILGFPVRIVDEEKYQGGKSLYNRNAFIFNVCFVFERDAELSVFEPVVRKTGRTLRAMEEASSLLSNPPPGFSMANLLEQVYLDLNAYCETSVSLLDIDLDLGLFPFYANPPDVKIWDVPIAVAPLDSMKSYSWDITLYNICSFIDGVNHVKRIAELAEVDLYLARQCIQHLVYYNAVIMVDLFQFSNSYAALPDIADVVQHGEEEDEGVTDLRTECENYVFIGARDSPPIPFSTLLTWYSHLKPGLSISSWMEELSLDSKPVDVRRMVQFGVIKGFLRRVYAFPVWLDHPSFRPASHREGGGRSGRRGKGERKGTVVLEEDDDEEEKERVSRRNTVTKPSRRKLEPNLPSPSASHHRRPSSTHSLSTPAPQTPLDAPAPPQTMTSTAANAPIDASTTRPPESPAPSYPPSLPLLLDGSHSTDEVCLRYGITWRTLEVVLRHLGGAGNEDREEEEEEEEGSWSDAEQGRRRGSAALGGGAEKGPYGSKVVMMWV
ncbi:hypothetical protein JCM6882_005810 [Rhodosporidiobolus microsporus]